MSNKRILNFSINIPHFELKESGIPKEFQNFLKRNVTKEEAYELVGFRHSGWIVLFYDPRYPYLHNGNSFTG